MTPSTDTPNDDAVIQVRDLSIGWGDFTLLEDLTFDVRRGSVFVILGGSGCGKSTMLRHLVGLEQPQRGTIHVDGVGRPRMRIGPPPFGVMFQSGALFGSLTLAENVALPLRTWTDLDDDAIDAIVRAKLALVDLDGAETKLPAEISGGMKKRAGIARALAFEPKILFLDEPSAGLDPITAVELDDQILTLSEHLGMTIVVVTHELASIFKIADDCIMLDKAARGIIARGPPQQLRDTATLPFVRSFFRREPLENDA